MFDGQTLLITGGTGSFGEAVLKRFLDSKVEEIRIFSRDEKKQDDLRKKFTSPKLKFYIGDVRDSSSVENAVRGVDIIFHAAALKQVPSCEFHPLEAVKTNILGTENVLESAIKEKVGKVVCLSTDKAVYPINAMGISKAMMEKILIAKARVSSISNTVICCTRYGNVMCSRGSVIPLFCDALLKRDNLPITDPNMTRFMMTLEDAVELVIYAFLNGKNGELIIKKAPAASIGVLAKAIQELANRQDASFNIIGTRHGEKLYETLLSREEVAVSHDNGDFFTVPPDLRDLNYSKYVEEGKMKITLSDEYNSHNTDRLDTQQMKELLMTTEYMQRFVSAVN
jgi:UDP-N-acetylglucosamine 4,6-dehydratase/5-epimerase